MDTAPLAGEVDGVPGEWVDDDDVPIH
jgi:hypothetical protein